MSAGQEESKGSGLDEPEVTRKKISPVDMFSVVLVLVVVFAVVLSVYFYRQAFGGDLSVKTANWSAFGSFVGGVFGPLISFVTLVAILRTIWLQRELLLTQQHEFDVMQKIQDKTLRAQLKQFEKADDEASMRAFEEGRNKYLTMVELYIAALSREADTKAKRFDMLAQWVIDGKAPGRQNDVQQVDAKLKELDVKISQMYILYDDILLDDFDSLDQIKDHFKTTLAKLFSKDSTPADVSGSA